MQREPLAEQGGARPRRIAELRPSLIVEMVGTAGDVPVQEEQGGQPLLSVERFERSVRDLAVYKVERESITAGCSGVERV